MAQITWYDVLGVTAGASDDTLRYAHEERMRQLSPSLFSGASSAVLQAASRARELVDAAWRVLGDPDRRQRYDAEIGVRGQPRQGFAEAPSYGPTASDALLGAAFARNLVLAVALALRGMVPQPALPRQRVVVPDLRGLFYQPCRDIVTLAGLRLAVVRLTADPMPAEGLVVGQSPQAGASVRQQSTLTVRLWHPPRTRAY